MELELIVSTDGLTGSQEMLELGTQFGRICYANKPWSELREEPVNIQLLDRLINSGHHSVFEHSVLSFNLLEVPKALAMVLNNEKQYATSERSARYTVMSNIDPKQKELYDKWMEILTPEIGNIYP
jgi:thymidylate synthase ThyX